ncbi:RlmE family RNA methyltransferase [Candidatus Bathyarchaeota archaeon]|nr:RlmE family RNA methyltransferase [Candidatus Bathyarchaeota archaeon]
MTKSYLRERKRDYYYRKAKQEDYRSRAVYKLLEAIKKYRFIKKGDVVVDLGAAPGGWVQGCLKTVGKEGFVLAVDLRPIKPFKEPNVAFIKGDVSEEETLSAIIDRLPSAADAVISDLSPNLSGVWEVDHARQIKLAYDALEIARKILKKGGNFFAKMFEGDLSNDFIKEVKRNFHTIKIFRPKASRKRSSEIYVLGLGFKGRG